MGPFLVLGFLFNRFNFIVFGIKIPEANRIDPDQTLHSVESELGLHGFHNTLKRASKLNWLRGSFCLVANIYSHLF